MKDKIREIMKKRPMMKMMVDDEKKQMYAVPHPDTVKELAELVKKAEKELESVYKEIADFESRHETWLKLMEEKNNKIIDLENRLRLYEKKAGDAFVDKTP
jgi:predicted  nucleic acid-binding Zn-ribbon protein